MNEALRKMRAVEWQGKERLAPVLTAACGIAINSGILASLIYLLLTLSSMVIVRPAFAKSAPVGAGVRLPAAMTVRKIEWAGLGQMNASDTDGKRAVYRASDGNLYLGDLAGHSRRILMKNAPEVDQTHDYTYWIPSRDFSMVALALTKGKTPQAAIAVVKANGSGYRELLVDDSQPAFLDSNNDTCMNWSWDNRYLAIVTECRQMDGRMLIVSVADGKYHQLARTQSGELRKAAFSPDGQFVAYEVFVGLDDGKHETSRIFTVPVQGGEARQVFESDPFFSDTYFADSPDSLKDWTADGRFLAIRDTREGRPALFLLPMSNGAAAGPVTSVLYGEYEAGYTTLSGALVYQDRGNNPLGQSVFLASLDADGHLGTWRRQDLLGMMNSMFGPLPSFTPDGSRLAYVVPREETNSTDLVLRDLATGKDRVLHRFAGNEQVVVCRYSVLHPRLICLYSIGEPAESSELVSVAVDSGAVVHLGSLDDDSYILLSSPGDTLVYAVRPGFMSGDSYVRWDLAAGKQTELDVPGIEGYYQLSTDAQWFVGVRDDAIIVVPAAGGKGRTLVSGIKTVTGVAQTTPDSKWVLYGAQDSNGKPAFFRVPLSGGKPERMGDFPAAGEFGLFSISPDGRQIQATNVSPNDYDLWVLENFEPAAEK